VARPMRAREMELTECVHPVRGGALRGSTGTDGPMGVISEREGVPARQCPIRLLTTDCQRL